MLHIQIFSAQEIWSFFLEFHYKKTLFMAMDTYGAWNGVPNCIIGAHWIVQLASLLCHY